MMSSHLGKQINSSDVCMGIVSSQISQWDLTNLMLNLI